jgi:Ca-activated chloride channel family protein
MASLFNRLQGLGFVTCLLAAGSGCSASNDLGATPGGAQDDALANEKIEQGYVPMPEDITVEGVLAAHDFPLEGPACEQELCINSAYAVAPTLDRQRASVFVQIGFDTGIDGETFHRSPLNLSVVVDRSGSMAGEKIVAVRTALGKLLDQLNTYDRLSIVLFDDRVDVLLPSTYVTDRESIRDLLPRITARGATNMALGLRTGYEQIADFSGTSGVSDRVMVFTDAIVNTGDTDTRSFIQLATTQAEKNVGLSLFGVGTDLNQSLVLAISKLKGNNYFFLSDRARIASVFDSDFDYLVTPLAYNLHFTLTPTAEFLIYQVYGYSGQPVGANAVDITVPTVFLSRGHGAIVARLEPTSSWPSGNPPVAALSMTYDSASTGETASQEATTTYEGSDTLGDATSYFSQRNVRRTVAFVNGAIGEKRACSFYHSGSESEAIDVLDDTIALLDRESLALNDLELSEQASILADLRRNMVDGAPSGNDTYDDSHDASMVGCSIGSAGVSSTRPLLLLLGVGLWSLRRRRSGIRQ